MRETKMTRNMVQLFSCFPKGRNLRATGRILRDVLRDPEGRWMRWELTQKLDGYTVEGRGSPQLS